jgi:hypothetical protein
VRNGCLYACVWVRERAREMERERERDREVSGGIVTVFSLLGVKQFDSM